MMRIFNIQEWKSLWNLGKPRKERPVNFDGNPVHTPDEVDARLKRRGNSLPSSVRSSRSGHSRQPARQYHEHQIQPEPNGMVEPRRGSMQRETRRSTLPDLDTPHQPAPPMKPHYNKPPQPLPRGSVTAPSNSSTTPEYATIERRPWKQPPQPGAANGTFAKSRSYRDVHSPGDELDLIDGRDQQAHGEYRQLTKEPLSGRNEIRGSNPATARTKSTEHIIVRPDEELAKATESELQNDSENSEPSREAKFRQARNKFEQLADASRPSFQRYIRPQSNYGIRVGSTGALREKFSSQSNVADRPTKGELHKSAAALNSAGGSQSSDDEHYDYPRRADTRAASAVGP